MAVNDRRRLGGTRVEFGESYPSILHAEYRKKHWMQTAIVILTIGPLRDACFRSKGSEVRHTCQALA